ncbi:hypothetical protein MCUN1_002614 [Malassezia cuniculi]|uniref:SPT2 chromatin protein n=1 Tax=Malassezia cuniculi TaxID=948313 RepID=A0AAF0EZT8_9BASI|nr:hypothetical protein MCUN1_002614 [Malassezia cuniculi]
MSSSYAQLKKLALANTAAQREQLDARLEEQARKRAASQEADEKQAKERAAWLAREKQRAAALEAQKKRREAAIAAKRQEKEKSAAASVLPPRERSAAFRKAQAAADKKRAQLDAPRRSAGGAALPAGAAAGGASTSKAPTGTAAAAARPTAPRTGGLTREEKRMKRMAQEMGVSFRRTVSSRGTAQASVPRNTAVGPTAPPRKRPMTARERFLEEEKRRKAAKEAGLSASAAASAADYDESDIESDYESGEEDESPESLSALRSQIWSLFGKNRDAYVSRDCNSDDDMEAGASDVLREELRSALAGRHEDEREEALLEARRREKLRRANVS